MSTYSFKKLTAQNLQECFDFHRSMSLQLAASGQAGYLRPVSLNKMRHMICNHQAVAAFTSENKMIAQSFLIHNPPLNEVGFLINMHRCFGKTFYQLAATSVHPDHQGQGLSDQLLDHLLKYRIKGVVACVVALPNFKGLSNRLNHGFILAHFGKTLIKKWNLYGLIKPDNPIELSHYNQFTNIHYSDRTAIACRLRDGFFGVGFDKQTQEIIMGRCSITKHQFQNIRPVSLFF